MWYCVLSIRELSQSLIVVLWQCSLLRPETTMVSGCKTVHGQGTTTSQGQSELYVSGPWEGLLDSAAQTELSFRPLMWPRSDRMLQGAAQLTGASVKTGLADFHEGGMQAPSKAQGVLQPSV